MLMSCHLVTYVRIIRLLLASIANSRYIAPSIMQETQSLLLETRAALQRLPESTAIFRKPSSPKQKTGTAACWGSWYGDGRVESSGALPSALTLPSMSSGRWPSPPPTRSGGSRDGRSTVGGTPSSPTRPSSTSLLDGFGCDRTAGCPDHESGKDWSRRSMSQMADHGTIPQGLPLGLTDTEKKLWLALYVKSRENLLGALESEGVTVRTAVDRAIRTFEKNTIEFRFGTAPSSLALAPRSRSTPCCPAPSPLHTHPAATLPLHPLTRRGAARPPPSHPHFPQACVGPSPL